MKIDLKINFNNIKGFVFYCAFFLLITAFSIQFNALDNDIWSRLIMGKHVVQTHNVMFQDIISFTNTHTWFDPEWLSSAFLYFIQDKFGILGLSFLKIISIFLMFVLLVECIKRLANDYKFEYSILVFLLFILLFKDCGFIYFLRCQFVTFWFFILWIFLLEKVRTGNDKLLCFFPLIMLFWLNLHGGAIAGIGVLILYCIGEFLNKKPVKKYLLTLIFCGLVFLINPWGADYLEFIMHSANLDRSWIMEWQSPFDSPFLRLNKFIGARLFFIFAFAIYLFELILNKQTFKTFDKTKFLVFMVVSYLAAVHLKHLVLFFIVTFMYFYRYFCLFFKKLFEKIFCVFKFLMSYQKQITSFWIFLAYFLMFLYSILALLVFPIRDSHKALYLNNFPVYPMQFLIENNIKGKIFSVFSISAYVGYKGYPNLKIYMDGRQEQVYDLKTFDEGMFFLNWSGDYPQVIIDKYSPDIFLLENDWKVIYKFFENNPKYKLIYKDKIFSIYTKTQLAKFGYIKPEKDDEKMFREIFDTNIDFKKD